MSSEACSLSMKTADCGTTMRWKTPQLEKPVETPGKQLARIIFALWPHDCEDGYTRWLEYIHVIEEFKTVCSFEEWGPQPEDRWVPVRYYPLNMEPKFG